MIQKIRDKIKIFLLTNRFLRRVKILFGRNIFPLFLKGLLILLAILIVLIVSFKIFKPNYIDKIQHKTVFYLLHYLNLDNREFKKINISGNIRTKEFDIIRIAEDTKKNITINSDQNYQPLIQKLIARIKEELPWINQVVITRNMPDILNIAVTEYEPFAIWQNDDVKYVTDRDGNLVLTHELSEFDGLVVLSGKGANTHARSLFNIFAIDPDLSSNVYSATWIGGRRWDIRFENGLLIKLPENNISEAWQNLIKIYNISGAINGLKTIDLRIKDKVYLEYNDSVIKELKNV